MLRTRLLRAFFCAVLVGHFPIVLLAAESSAVLVGRETTATVIVQVVCEGMGRLRIDLVDASTFGAPDHFLLRRELFVSAEYISRPVSATFEGLTPGRYALRAFIDTNGDGRLNSGLGGPTEPWALSWAAGPKRGIPRFKDLSFTAAEGTTTIRMEVRK